MFDPEPWQIPDNSGSTFGPTLASYVASLVVGIEDEGHWVLRLADYDFSLARAQLVMSRPCLCPQSIPPTPDWRVGIEAGQLLGEVEAMVVMPSVVYSEHYEKDGLKVVDKIERLKSRAENHRVRSFAGEPLLRLAVERETDNELHQNEQYDAVGLHLPGEDHKQSLFGYLRKSDYGAARRAINAKAISPLLKHGVIKLEARIKHNHAMALID